MIKTVPARMHLYKEPQINKEEKVALTSIYRETLHSGTVLYTCASKEQAERFRLFLMRYLPKEYACLTIRENQVNTFTEIITEKTNGKIKKPRDKFWRKDQTENG